MKYLQSLSLSIILLLSFAASAGGIPYLYDSEVGTPTVKTVPVPITFSGKQFCEGDKKPTRVKRLKGILVYSGYDVKGVTRQGKKPASQKSVDTLAGDSIVVSLGEYSVSFPSAQALPIKYTKTQLASGYSTTPAPDGYSVVRGYVRYGYDRAGKGGKDAPKFAIPGHIGLPPPTKNGLDLIIGNMWLLSPNGQCKRYGNYSAKKYAFPQPDR